MQDEGSRHSLIRYVYLRGLGVIYLIAFASMLPQLLGLIGSNGISPAAEFLQQVPSVLPAPECYRQVPTVFWLGASDNVLVAVTICGCVASFCCIAGFVAAPALIVCWFLYLSLVVVGQNFLSFQWDSLLLEAGLLAIFMAPWTVRETKSTLALPRSIIFMFMTRWLLFRLMLLSGLVKILSDVNWRNLSALDYHYETQPLPTPLAWYLHQLPPAFDAFSTVVMFFVELAVPFLMLMPWYRVRVFAAAASVLLQVLILASGNYTFFNLLTILLCLSLFDTSKLPRFEAKVKGYPFIPAAVAVTIFVISVEEIVDEFSASAAISSAAEGMMALVRPLRSVNTYGLFRVMTTTRDEITIEGSNDGVEWKAYVFPFKPGPLDRAPPIVAPYQPRLDWQMWFASLGTAGHNPWMVGLAKRLLEGSPPVLALFQTNPFPDKPPRFVRATIATYHFTDGKERDATHNWWKAGPSEFYLPPLQRENVE